MKKWPTRQLVLGSALLVFSFSLSGCRAPAAGDGRILLADGGKSQAFIVAGEEDRVAALSLQSHIKREAGAEPEIVAPGEDSGRRERCAILVGTPRSNSAVALAIKEQGLSVDEAGLGDEGYVLKTVAGPKRHRIIAAGNGKAGRFLRHRRTEELLSQERGQ